MPSGVPDFAIYDPGADTAMNASRELAVRAVVVHVTEGTDSRGVGKTRHHDSPGTFNFLVCRDGSLYCYYPAHVRCSHAAGANHAGPGIESEGFTGQPLTGSQIVILGRLFHWLSDQYGVPLTYRTGDPRCYVDTDSFFSGFIAHRAVDYPPDHSLLHYDEITPAEWQAAIGGGTDEMTEAELLAVLRGEGLSGGTWQPKLDQIIALLTQLVAELKAKP